MKSAVLSLCVLVSIIAPPYGASYVTYGRLNCNASLYGESGELICTLPQTYYVVINGSGANGAIPVSYKDLSGYVKSDDVTAVNYEPVTKFASATVRPSNDGMPVNLRSKPSAESGVIICSVPPDAELSLYGGANGDELFAGAGTLWQYVKYRSPQGDLLGYAYAPQLTEAVIVPNSGEAVVKQHEQVYEQGASLSLTKNGSVALAVLLTVPAGVIMLVLFYRPDSKRTPRHSK